MLSQDTQDSIDFHIEMAEAEAASLSIAPAVAMAERASQRHEAELDQLEQQQLENALAESQKLQYMSVEERMAAGEAQEAESEAREPPLERPEDLDKWKRWADAYADLHTRYTHPRTYDDTNTPTRRQLSLFTSAREISRQFGAGVQLYLDLMAFYLTACVLGGAM